ncbi:MULTISPECIES: hypothetical protein [Campylobacterales]|uniref:hypothetical protein n=1 Tax=Campylobacterales TaxID=213849 RepID=UPI000A33736D|nr:MULTISPECIES: hypothetical protein [Campylobacterales]MCL9823415.1 hypothetical protein [Helicobacter colisuis]
MDNSKTDNEFNTQEIQDIISTQELRKETLKTNTNNLTAGESKLIKRLESYILTFDLKALRGENLPVGAKNIKGFLKNIFGEQAMYALYYKYGKPTLYRVKDRIKKQKRSVEQSHKIIDIQKQYPQYKIIEAYKYGCVAGKFNLNAKDIEIFISMLEIASGNMQNKNRKNI